MHRKSVILASVLIPFLVGACAGKATPTPTPTPPSAQEIYIKAELAMAALDSFRISGSFELEAGSISVEMSLDPPGRFMFSAVQLDDQGREMNTEFMFLDKQVYMKVPGAEDWFVFPLTDAEAFELPELSNFTGSLLEGVKDLTFEGSENVASIPTYHIHGTFSADLSTDVPLPLGPSEGGSLDLWVAIDNFWIHKIVFSGPGEPSQAATLILSDFNQASLASLAVPTKTRPFEELLQVLGDTLGENLEAVAVPLIGEPVELPQNTEEVTTYLESLPPSAQECVRKAVGEDAYAQLLAGLRMPSLEELSAASGCLP